MSRVVGIEQPDDIQSKVALKPDDIRVCTVKDLLKASVFDNISSINERIERAYLDPYRVGEELVEHLE